MFKKYLLEPTTLLQNRLNQDIHLHCKSIFVKQMQTVSDECETSLVNLK